MNKIAQYQRERVHLDIKVDMEKQQSVIIDCVQA